MDETVRRAEANRDGLENSHLTEERKTSKEKTVLVGRVGNGQNVLLVL